MAMSNLRLRIISAIFIMFPIIFLTWYNIEFAKIFIYFFALIISFELLEINKRKIKIILSLSTSVVLYITFEIYAIKLIQNNYFNFISAGLIAIFFIYNLYNKKYKYKFFLQNTFSLLFAYLISICIFLTINTDKNIYISILLIASTSDTFAFIIGKVFGKKQLAKNISPGKTVEGAIAGLIFSTTLGIAVFTYWIQISILLSTLYSIVFAITTQLGDLAFSQIKRNRNIKDYGTIFPGHGGLLDRVDSCLGLFIISYFIF
tara:strand:+ start:1215 stop:1997 length:783 start_codon:yes stop_codon:yes gene_type:complete